MTEQEAEDLKKFIRDNYPIGTKVVYSDVNGNGYPELEGLTGHVENHFGIMIEVSFGSVDSYYDYLCYVEELRKV